jgi:hypothetical protein
MKTITDSTEKIYKVTESNTSYHNETPDDLINVLERIRYRGQRVKFCYGDTNTGKSWNEENNIIGTIGRSTGTIKIPLLIATSRSHGGGSILTNCILKITETGTGVVLYQHPKFQQTVIKIVPSDLPEYQFNTMVNGSLYGHHHSLRSAQICMTKLT